MTLLLDIGNSQIKWQDSHCFTDTPRTFPYHCENLLEQLECNFIEKSLPTEHVVIASVVAIEIDRAIEKWFIERWGSAVQFLSSDSVWKRLRSGYDRPETLGVDRWYALVGAASRYPYPFFVCDIGSAMTIDLVDHQGNHLGGFITPGLDMMIQSLNKETCINTSIKADNLAEWNIPTNTQRAVINGCIQSQVSTIEMVKRKYANKSRCILTGGGAEAIERLLEFDATVEKNLIFYGIQSVIQE